MDVDDHRVQKLLSGVCWAKDCQRVSSIETGFLRYGEERKKPHLCGVHQIYNFRETHYGEWNLAESKWTCCGKDHLESFCGDLKIALDTFQRHIPISEAKQQEFEANQRRLEARIESDFCSENWDRS
jgi:hypothetical protein